MAEVRTYGVLLSLEGSTYLLHRNQMADIENRRADPTTDFQEGQTVKVRSLSRHLLITTTQRRRC